MEDVTAAKGAVTQFYQKFSLPGCVLITLGSQGLVYAADATSPVEHIPADAVTAVDTTVRTYDQIWSNMHIQFATSFEEAMFVITLLSWDFQTT